MMKKDGGRIKDWQIHTLSIPTEKVRKVRPDIVDGYARIFSGTVVEDPTGRWLPGYHMRSSIIVELNRETGVCETTNTIYHLEGKEGEDVLPDMGDKILTIFY